MGAQWHVSHGNLEKWPSHRRTKSCKSSTSARVVQPQVTNQWCCMPRHVNVPPRSSKPHVVLAMWCFFPATIFSSLFFNAVHFYFHPIFIQSHPSLLLTHAFPWPCPFFFLFDSSYPCNYHIHNCTPLHTWFCFFIKLSIHTIMYTWNEQGGMDLFQSYFSSFSFIF